MIEIKVRNEDNWAVRKGCLKTGKWYKANYAGSEMFMVSSDDSEDGVAVYIFTYNVEVREVLKLEVGKKYVTKGGVVVGPMVASYRNWVDEYGNQSEYADNNGFHYSENGRFIFANEDDEDNIVSECFDEFQTIELKVDAKKSLETYARIFSETLEEGKNNPVEEVTVKRLKAGTYGRLKLSTDGYHAINISVVDGGRTWSKDDLEQAIETLTKIIDCGIKDADIDR